MATGASPGTAGPPGSYQQEDAAGHSWHGGHSWGQRGQQAASPSVPGSAPLPASGRGCFGQTRNRHGAARKGLAFPTAIQQLGVWLNCSSVAKEPRFSQETDG